MQFIFVLIILVCVLLALIVLIQNPKGGGLDSSFQSVNQIGGVKRTADFLEKSTWTLAIVLFVLCLVSAGLINRNVGFDSTSPRFDETAPVQQQPMDDGSQVPAEDNPFEND